MKKVLATLIVFSFFLTTGYGQYAAEFEYSRACKGQMTHFKSTPVYPAGVTVVEYLWDLDGNLIFSNTNISEFDYLLPNGPGIYDIGHKVKFSNGHMESVYHQVTMSDVFPDFESNSFCFGDLTRFYDKSTSEQCAIIKYEWNFGNNIISNVKNPTYTYESIGNYNVSLTLTSDNGCTGTTTKQITIHDVPHLSLSYNMEPVSGTTNAPHFKFYKGQSLNATINIVGPYSQIIWSDGFTEATHSITESGFWSVDVGNEFGCVSRLNFSTEVVYDGTFNPMPLFTPNNDGYNDVWKIKSFLMPDEVWNVTIYSRYGDEVYSNSNYLNNWDGKYEGKLVPDGTYYYYITEKKSGPYRGALNILTEAK
jgi:gliding motility-associated-like protein